MVFVVVAFHVRVTLPEPAPFAPPPPHPAINEKSQKIENKKKIPCFLPDLYGIYIAFQMELMEK